MTNFGPKPHPEHVAQICLRGHVVLGSLKSSPQFAKSFCEDCGSATISECQACKWPITGIGTHSWMGGPYEPPRFCGECGTAFPWAEKPSPSIRASSTISTHAQMTGGIRIPPMRNSTESTRANHKEHMFLSYCRDNQTEVRRLRDDLVAANERVWWDQDIQPGQDWKFEIRKAMKTAYAVVLCFSKQSAARATSGIYPEAIEAINLFREYPPGSIFLIPVRLSSCIIPSVDIDGVRTLDQIQYQDIFPSGNYTASLHKLLNAIRNAPHHP